MLETLIKKGFILYIFLSIFEFALTYGSGSILKLYGFVLMGLWLLLSFKRGMKIDRYLLFLIYFFLWMAMTLLWAKGGKFSTYYIFSMGNMIVLVIIASSLIWKWEEVLNIFTVLQLGALVFSLLLLLGGNVYHEKSIRSTILLFGQELDPNSIAGLLLPATLLSFSDLIKLRKIIFSSVIFLLSVFAIVSTGSRGGVLALLAGLIVLICKPGAMRNRVKSANKLKAIIISIIIVFVFFKFAVPQLDKALIARYKYSTVLEDRGSSRLELWGKGLELFNSRVITGIGIGGYEEATGKGMHNQFLIVLVEGGLVGFALFITALAKIFGRCWSYRSILAQAILVSTMVVIFFLDAYNMKFFWNGIIVAVIMIKSTKDELEIGSSLLISTNS